ncbi:MAG TPA: bifunctional precorrin-2 dehydrogenase/sirohydrochlorin ferrochelatase [Tepidisphaeraceae bacterium]|nr:bifunctional precorrin-2 dehydrogenase/sirohydrochlorin ferrochelatase [Tepidisphaeraceae bacterium]
MPSGYPILLDVAHRPIVIVGGGNVAQRKAGGLLEAGATDVRAVAPQFTADFPQAVRRRIGNYEPGDLDGASLVFAATDSAEVNAAVVRDAGERGIWVNRADFGEEDAGDFTVAAAFRRGPAIVAVSTENAALSAMIRTRLAEAWDPGWTAMASAMKNLRPLIRKSGLSSESRRRILKELATDAALDTLAKGGENGLMDWLAAKFPELRRT